MEGFIKENIQMILSTIVLLAATVYFVALKNFEFLVYSGTLIILILIIFFTDKKFKYTSAAKWGFFIWMVIHMAGGSVYIGATRLYDVILLHIIGEPYHLLRYDQFVHFFCYIVMTLFMFTILKTITKEKCSQITLIIILILAGSSIGAINEIIEFSTVVMFESNGVGGYFNTLIDICANLVGAITAAIYLIINKDINLWQNKKLL